MQIEIPDSPELTARAKAEGFDDVADYVRSLVQKEPPKPIRPAPAESLDVEERIRRFRDFVKQNAARGVTSVDDSRESIYEGRGL